MYEILNVHYKTLTYQCWKFYKDYDGYNTDVKGKRDDNIDQKCHMDKNDKKNHKKYDDKNYTNNDHDNDNNNKTIITTTTTSTTTTTTTTSTIIIMMSL